MVKVNKMKTRLLYLFITVLFIISCTKVFTSPDDNLAEPSNLTLEQIDLESIQLTWQDNSAAEESFQIDRKIDDGDWEENYQFLPANTTSFIDPDLLIIGNYSYRISAFADGEFSNYTEADIDFFYDDVYSISLLFSGQINLELYQSFAIDVVLKDSLENIVQREYDVWFKLLSCPQGFSINNTLFGIDDSLCVHSYNGQAIVSLNAGSQAGLVTLKIYTYNSENEEISAVKSNIVIHNN